MTRLAGRTRWIGGIALAAGLAVVSTTGYLQAAEALEQCKAVSGEGLIESSEFTPYEQQRSGPLGRIEIAPDGSTAAVPESARIRVAALAGLPRQHTMALSNGSVYSYFLERPIDGMTVSDFRRLGGIQLDQDPRDGREPFASGLLKQFPGRAIPVRIGPYDGAMTWADPDENGTRSHNIYWSDNEFNFSLIGVKSAADMINLARSLVC